MGFLAAALPFAAAGAQLIQGVGGFMAGQSKKKAAFAQGREELSAANEGERQIRVDARRAIGSQLASQFGNGLEGGTGTALDALRESKIEAALDVLEVRRQGVSRNLSLRAEGKAAEREGYFALASGLLGAASSVHGMQSDWAQARTGRSGSQI
jgi:hypothetical protein